MLYLVAILLPPVAVLLCGKPFQAMLNVILTICLWIPGMIHALFVVNNHYADKRTERLARAMGQQQPTVVVQQSPPAAPGSPRDVI